MAKSRYNGRRRKAHTKRRSKRVYNKYDQGYAEKITKVSTLVCSAYSGRSTLLQAHSIAWFPVDKDIELLNPDFGSAPNLESNNDLN